MKVTNENFIKHRLSKMIEKAEKNEEEVCMMCPGARRFNPESYPDANIKEKSEDFTKQTTWCKLCQETAGLSYKIQDKCPCHRLDNTEAFKRAKKAVDEYYKRTKKT